MDVNKRLFQAVRNGNLQLAEEIINTYGISYSKAWSMGYVLLRISTKYKHTAITKLLLSSGARVNTNNRRTKKNDTPLHLAALSGQLEIVEMLLNKGANIHAKNEYGSTALQSAVFRNKLDVVELLLNRGASVNEKKSDGSTILHTAVQNGNLRAVEILLNHKVHVNAVSNSYRKEGQTPLHFAAEKGNDRIVQLLIKNGANVDAKASGGLTPIFLATLNAKEKVVKQLLNHGADVDAQDSSGKTILFLAVELGSLKIVDHILKHGPDLNNRINKSSLVKAIYGTKGKYKLIVDKLLQHGFTFNPDHKLLQTAVEKGYMQIVENCLQTSSNLQSFLINVPNKCFSLLHAAVKNKQYRVADMLIKYKANVNLMDEANKKPMYYATQNGDIKMLGLLLANGASITNCSGLLINAVKKQHLDMVHLLLKHKVNVNEVDDIGRTPLHFVALNEVENCLDSGLCMQLIRNFIKTDEVESTTVKGQIAKVLIDAGADVNAISKDGESTLHCACFKGYYNVVEILFQHNAKMFADETGVLPIHLSAYSGNVDILKMLISKGADVNSKTIDGSTAVHFATHELQYDFLEYLLDHDAKIDEQEEDGSTALHIAAKNNSLDLVQLLLNYGADIDCTDNRGRTALNIATREGNNLIVRALLEYGCDIKNHSKTSFTPFESAMMLGVDIFGDLFNHFGSVDEDDDDDDYYGSDYDCFNDSDYNDYYGSENDYYDSDGDIFDHERNIFSTNQITEMLQHHVLMMKAANLEVKEEIFESDATSTKLCTFKADCEQEIEKLKSEKICPNTNVTFYDILAKPIGNVAIYTRNPKIVEVLKANDYKIQFPIYSGLINGKTMRGINRKDLLDRGYVFFDLLSNSLSIRLPYNCTEKICSYLSDKDLRILIEASKPSK